MSTEAATPKRKRKSSKDLLAPVREILGEPSCWVKHTFAAERVIEGEYGGLLEPVGIDDSRATCYCLMGALQLAHGNVGESLNANVCTLELSSRIGAPEQLPGFAQDNIQRWNDSPARTFEDVQQLLREPFYG